ncbi:glycosyltransferase family 1 protein [soil metagenome]
MRVGISALAASNSPGHRQSGVHRYAVELIRHLTPELGDHRAVVYAVDGALPYLETDEVAIRSSRWPIDHPAMRLPWEHLVLPMMARRDKIDLFHGLAFARPRLLSRTTVVTIHDLAFLRWPEQVPGRRSAYLSRAVRDAAGHARRLIAVSEHTKQDIVELMGIDPGRVDVTPLGVNPAFTKSSEEQIRRFREAQGLPNPFILAVGNLEPRKNLESLVTAFEAIASSIPHELVLLGADGWKTDPLFSAIASSPVTARIRLAGFVVPGLLPDWYSACDVFVLPSRYEGFGLSLLEAMACGAPSIAGNVAAIPEVAGDAAVLVEPEAEPLGEAIVAVIHNNQLKLDLSQRGRTRAAQFRWEETARLTVETYEKAMQ